MEKVSTPSLGLVITSTAPSSKAEDRVFGAPVRHLGADDDRHRPFRHDLLQEGQAVHAGNDKIGDDHIRRFFSILAKAMMGSAATLT